ncbi:MAG: F-type H+-transporting ATPase subunit b [Marinobacter sp. T13-3]|jgi:F-type H+-transporting ATPase subunit b|nr:MAG: F-type H+-transporting ATPase subunit b [Marinobacter sp. T13-3]
MAIDWITVSAQVVNFLILVWLLKHFLYQPIIHAMDNREKGIRSRMEAADQREEAAADTKQSFEQKLAELDRERNTLLDDTKREAQQAQKRMLELAREETTRIRHQWMQEIQEEKQAFIESLQQQSLEAVESITRRALEDLADEQLENNIARLFLRKLAEMDGDLHAASRGSAEPVTIYSSFPLDDTLQETLLNAVHEKTGREEVPVHFKQSPELICGIELVQGGQVISWNLSDYLEEMTAAVKKAFRPVETDSTGG